MTEQEREAWEKQYAGDFLRFMGIPFIELQSLREFCTERKAAGPDVKATIGSGCARRRVGLELALYSTDADKRKGSVSLRRAKIRDRLRKELAGFLPKFPEIDQFQIRVQFRRGEEQLRTDNCRGIAREFADLLGPILLHVQRDCSFDAIFDPTVFNAHPYLREWVRIINVYRNHGDYRDIGGWFNDGSGFEGFGIEPDQVCRRIKDHDRSKYDLNDVAECWLVIYSTGLGGSAARPREMEQHSLSSPHIAEAVARSGFDRAYFWSQDFGWAALLGSVGTSGSGELAHVG